MRWWDKEGKWGETSPLLDQFGGRKKEKIRRKSKNKKRGKLDRGEKEEGRERKEKENFRDVLTVEARRYEN